MKRITLLFIFCSMVLNFCGKQDIQLQQFNLYQNGVFQKIEFAVQSLPLLLGKDYYLYQNEKNLDYQWKGNRLYINGVFKGIVIDKKEDINIIALESINHIYFKIDLDPQIEQKLRSKKNDLFISIESTQNLQFLKNLKNLTGLKIQKSNDINENHFKELSKLSSINVLILNEEFPDPKKCFKQIEESKNIKFLVVNNVEKLDAIQEMKYLISLSFMTNKPGVSFKPLAKLDQIVFLDAAYSHMTNAHMDHVGDLKDLAVLRLSGGNVNDAGLAKLEGLKKIKKLTLNKTRVSGEGLKILLSMPDLKVLNLSQNKIQDLKNLQELKQLQFLSLSSNLIQDKDLLNLQNLSQLKILNLSKNNLSSDGLRKIAGLTDIQVLDLNQTMIDEDGLKFLEQFSKLQSLKIKTNQKINQITVLKNQKELENLEFNFKKDNLKSIHQFPKLNSLNLSFQRDIKNQDVKLISSHKGIKSLNLTGTSITGEALKYLCDMKQLKELTLMQVSLNNEELKNLKPMVQLTYLNLSNMNINEKEIEWISDLTNLEELNITQNNVSDEWIKDIIKLKNLKILHAGGTAYKDFTPGGYRQIKRQLPECEINPYIGVYQEVND